MEPHTKAVVWTGWAIVIGSVITAGATLQRDHMTVGDWLHCIVELEKLQSTNKSLTQQAEKDKASLREAASAKAQCVEREHSQAAAAAAEKKALEDRIDQAESRADDQEAAATQSTKGVWTPAVAYGYVQEESTEKRPCDVRAEDAIKAAGMKSSNHNNAMDIFAVSGDYKVAITCRPTFGAFVIVSGQDDKTARKKRDDLEEFFRKLK